VVTVFLVNMGKTKYAWISAIPAIFVGSTTITAGVLSVQTIFWPLTKAPNTAFQGYLDTALMSVFIAGVLLVAVDAVRRIWKTLHGTPVPQEAFGAPEQHVSPMRCC